MTFNTSQVSYYMTQRKKGITQHISAMKAGISVRSGRRIEKGEWAKNSVRHWRTRKDPLEAVWDSMLVPLLKERPALTPTTLLEMLQDKYPGQYPNSLRRTMQRRVCEWKLQYGAEQEVMFRQRHQPGLRGLSDFTELKGVVVTIAGKLLAHKLYHLMRQMLMARRATLLDISFPLASPERTKSREKSRLNSSFCPSVR